MIKGRIERFLNVWNSDLNKATSIMVRNKAYNGQLKNVGHSSADIKKLRRSFKTSELESHSLINEVANSLLIESKLPSKSYLQEGSIGAGNLVEIPWICIFDKEITLSAQNGYYIVFLFRSDMSGVYMSLNQGWTQYKNRYGAKIGREEIHKSAVRLKGYLKSNQGFSFEPINLMAKGNLGKGYEIGNICSKFYAKGNIPEDTEIIDDLRNLIGVYRELKGTVGNNILDIDSYYEEEDFQEEIQNALDHNLVEGFIKPPIKKSNKGSSSYTRNTSISHFAIKKANYLCENSNSHRTFISKKSGHQFVEAHHLIPMEYQGQFEYSIDVPENIISLCPNCHRAFHYSEDAVKKELLQSFLNLRQKGLLERGISVDFQQLIEFYQVE